MNYRYGSTVGHSGVMMAFHCSTAACNVAVKILSPKFDRLSYRFSRAIHMDAYSGKDNCIKKSLCIIVVITVDEVMM